MARIRTVKPEFFTSSDVVSLTPLARLFYVSLWCEADREGRLKWDERTLKMRYLPADDCSISDLADELSSRDMVILYEIDGKVYAEIPSFKTHQVINNREADSVLPARVKGACVRVLGEGRKGKEGRKEGTDPLIVGDKSPTPDCPHQEIIDLYHENCPTMARVRDWTDKRRKALQARWRENPDRQNIDWWKGFFDYVNASDFLSGRSGKFSCDLEWLTTSGNFVKVIEGRYENRSAA